MPVSLMGQYFPAYKAPGFRAGAAEGGAVPQFNRRLTRKEYGQAVDFAIRLELENVNIQEL